MGEVICPKCGEPWDVYTLIEDFDAETWLTLMEHRLGCPSCFGKRRQKAFNSNLNEADLLELHSWIESIRYNDF